LNNQVRAFTRAHRRRVNVLRSPVWVSEAFDPLVAAPPPTNKFVAIWDTGATSSVITQNVINKCGLLPTGMTNVHTASGQTSCHTFLACITLPNKVGFSSVRVTEGKIAGADVLIGMDIISAGDFAVSNYRGKTKFSFRAPSLASIDFVKELEEEDSLPAPKVGRNSPCPCGSGKKFKKCCGP